jgi:hypothetical protein
VVESDPLFIKFAVAQRTPGSRQSGSDSSSCPDPASGRNLPVTMV